MACIKKRRGKWVVDWRDAEGRRHWETKDDKKAAQDRLAEILKPEEADEEADTRTFEQYGKWWLENYAKDSVAESTYQEYEAVLKNHVYPLVLKAHPYPTLGATPFVEVKRPMIRELIAAKKAEGYEQSTIRNIMAPVRGMYFQAMDDEITDRNPAARIGKLNKRGKDKPKKKINPFKREEIQDFLKAAKDRMPHYYPLFLCAPRTGIRQGELIALKGIDVDFKSRFISVERTLSRGKIKPPKNGRSRQVDMSRQLTDVLQELLSKRRADALREELKKPADERRDKDEVVNEAMEGWLFQTPVGTQIDPSNLRKLFNRLLTDAKLRRVRFHDLRHSFASLLIEQREGLTYVKEQMGHSAINVTVDIYGHLVPGGNRAAVDKLDVEVAENSDQESEAAAN